MGSPWVNGKFKHNMSENVLFKKDERNYIYALGIQQVNTIGNIYFLDIFLSENNYVDLHYHSNASELTYCISGRAELSFINPNTNEWQSFVITPGEVVSIPQGFWHVAKALEDDTHLLATHDTDNLQTVFGSDILRITPDEVMANIYCLDEATLERALAPLEDTTIIGPPTSCERGMEETEVGDESETHKKPMFPNGRGEPPKKVTKKHDIPMYIRENKEVESRPRMQNHHSNERQLNTPTSQYNESVYTCPVCKQKRYRK